MKQNLLTACMAIVMVLLAVWALFGAMTIYEQDQFDESWIFTPAIIQDEIKPLYSEDFNADSSEY